MNQQTLAVHGGYRPDSAEHACAVPIYASASFTFDTIETAADVFALKEPGNIYTRFGNPTCGVLETRVTALEGGTAGVAFASGMAAITAVVATLAKSGQNIISCSSLYGGTSTLFRSTLKDLGIEVRFFDNADPDRIEGLFDENTRLVFAETQANPRNDIPDLRKLADAAHRHGVPFAVDNTVLTSVLCRAIDFGADIVIYSATKYLGGHGAHLAGLVVDSGRFDWKQDAARWPRFTQPDPSYNNMVFADVFGAATLAVYIRTHWLRDTGACLSPFGAFLILQGIETLPLRMKAHTGNAQKIAEFLKAHPAVESVNYAGLPEHPSHELAKKYLHGGYGAIIGFTVRGGYDAAVKFINSIKLCYHLVNIGDTKTLAAHSASTTHGQLSEEQLKACGISKNFIRLSVGIEDFEDIRADLAQALEGC